MAVFLEKEGGIKGLSPREKRFLDLPPYKRNGLIPSWSEVVNKFELTEFQRRDFRLLRGYYRAQRRIAEGKKKKAQRIFRGLEKNPDFLSLEEEKANLLNGIASFVRGKGR